jgi:hypothetical protein
MSILNPAQSINNWLASMVDDFGGVALKWINVYVIAPTDLSKYPYVNEVHAWVYPVSISLGGMFLIWNLFKLFLEQLAGVENRTPKQIVMKAVYGAVLASCMPYLLNLLLNINNAWVQFIADQGIKIGQGQVGVFSQIIRFDPAGASAALIIAALLFVILLLILGIQYIIRLGELTVLMLVAPLAAMTMVNEEMNLMPVWWRESVATVFIQSVQVPILAIILNMLGSGTDLGAYLLAIGLMIVLIKSPTVLKQFIYSSGAGRGVMRAAGGVGRMAIMRYAARKIINK